MRNLALKVLLVIVALLCGCSPQANNASRSGGEAGTRSAEGHGQPYNIEIKVQGDNAESERFERENASAEDRAEAVTSFVEEMPGVEQAAAVITGKTAIVGVKLEGKPDDGQIIEIKRKIEKEVKSLDSEIRHVAVTAAAELYERVLGISTGEGKRSGKTRGSGSGVIAPVP